MIKPIRCGQSSLMKPHVPVFVDSPTTRTQPTPQSLVSNESIRRHVDPESILVRLDEHLKLVAAPRELQDTDQNVIDGGWFRGRFCGRIVSRHSSYLG